MRQVGAAFREWLPEEPAGGEFTAEGTEGRGRGGGFRDDEGEAAAVLSWGP